MKYRKLDSDGDYSFGYGNNNFYQDSPEAVAQAVGTRLSLWEGEWYLDTSDGTPYMTQVLGERTKPLINGAIQRRILGTTGVSSITAYDNTLDADTRTSSIEATINTIYGTTQISETL